MERSFKKEQDNFEPFEDWAVRQILLRRATDEKSAWDMFKAVLAKHEVPCIFARGQWLIGKFAGITMDQVQSDEMRAALKASQDLKERDDIDAFIAKSEELAGKSRKGLDTSCQSMAVPEVDGESHVDVCEVYGIVKDLHADSDKVMMRHLTQEMNIISSRRRRRSSACRRMRGKWCRIRRRRGLLGLAGRRSLVEAQ